ncbi:hypothetical protein M5K25_006853 [Dendrobium thyrsiflorum]|uniref:Uncharacterized protein n=1 Tax=Dendrobium thyrsiflorum TaxID=117978 RepID=A0ABD0VJW1_DENTH
MSSLAFWNCRGANKREASLYLKEVVKDWDVFFGGIVETKMSSITRADFDNFMGVGWEFYLQPSNGASGGILVFWKSDVSSFSIIYSSVQCVIGKLEALGWCLLFMVVRTFVRRELWEKLELHSTSNLPSITGGDFNCILSRAEKKGGKKFSFSTGPQEMKNFMINNDFHDVKFFGPTFTWCNNKKGSVRILERLDRCLLNSKALEVIHQASVRHLAMVASDHCPIVLNNFSKNSIPTKLLRFEDVWLSYSAAQRVVANSWNKIAYGNAMEVLNKKFYRALRALHFWTLKKVKEIIANFCNWTGQQVNLLKSSIIFGKSVEGKWKRQISTFMGLKEVKELHYLGVKFALRRLNVADFSNIVEKVALRLGVWVLVKAVILSIPVFYSAHSLIPISILKIVDKLCRDFLWNKKDGIRGLHFVSWQHLCKSEEMGGQGIHSALSSIGPMRAKFAWNFHICPNLILHRSLYAKYGRNLLNAGYRRSCSSTWKILMSGASALRPIVRWRIANGKFINILNDIWILDRCLSKWPTFIAVLDEDNWNEEDLLKFFGKLLVEVIMQIEIYRDYVEDKLELCNSFTGNKISKLVRLAEEKDVEGRLDWNWIRKLELSPRVACFWWRLLKEALPTTDFLMRRRLLAFNCCPRGCVVVEDWDHITTSCAKLMQTIIRLKRWGLILPMYSSFMDCYPQLKTISKVNPFIAKLYCSVVFYSWKSRNIVVHEGHELSVDFIVSAIVSRASIQSKFNPLSGHWGAFQHELSLSFWHPPPPDWVKVNVDATILCSNEAGVGGVFRDHKDRFLSAFGFNCLHWDSGFLELFAFRSLRRAKGLIIEGDNANVIKYLQESFFKVVNHGDKDVLEDFSFLLGFDSFIFNHVNRGCNKLADCCANIALKGEFDWEDLGSNKVPPSFFYLLKEDCDRCSITE